MPVAMAQLSAYALAAHAVALGGRRRSERHNVQRAWKGHLAACVPRYHSLKRALDRKLEQRGGAEALYLEGWCSVTRTPGVVPSGPRKLQGAAVPRRWCAERRRPCSRMRRGGLRRRRLGPHGAYLEQAQGGQRRCGRPWGDDGRGGASIRPRPFAPPPGRAGGRGGADTDAAGGPHDH